MQEQKVQPSKREWKRGELYMVYTHILYSPWGRKESDMTEQLSLWRIETQVLMWVGITIRIK